MKELERLALLGDRRAQEECTRQGILLQCPFCGNDNIIVSNWGMWRCWCPKCHGKSDDVLKERDAIKLWNTRAAPPVGFCEICKKFRCGTCKRTGSAVDPREYCSRFEKMED